MEKQRNKMQYPGRCRMMLCAVSALCLCAPVYAADKDVSPAVEAVWQQGTIVVKGVVVDDTGQAVIGANVIEKGNEGNGVITNVNGEFMLTVKRGASLVISYIGYTSQELKAEAGRTLRVCMKEDSEVLSDVVVVGYGVQKKVNVTGSVAMTEGEELLRAPVADITNSLAGRLPGVRTLNSSGEPGYNGADFDIRGFGAPLVIVDGVPGDFSQIDANEIENISILKDASAAVYGIQAANGVVLVTTKRGTANKTQINLSAGFSWQQPTILPEMVNAAQYAELIDEDKMNRGLPVVYGPEELQKWREGGPGYESTDWLGLVKRNFSPQQQYNLNVRGGNEKMKYFASIGYLNQQGMWKSGDNNFNRYNFRSNLDAEIAEGLSFAISLSGRQETRNSPYSESYSTSATYIMNSIQRNSPLLSPYANGNPEYLALTNVPGFHPLALTNKDIVGYYKGISRVFDGSISLNYDASRFVKGLSAKVLYNYTYDGATAKVFRKKYNQYSYDEATDTYNVAYVGQDPSRLRQNYGESIQQVFQGSLSYNNVFAGKHDVGALLLMETRQSDDSNLEAIREYIIDSIDEINAGIDKNKDNSGTSSSVASIGYIARLNYAYDNRYLVEFSGRYDGSSLFPENSRWGFFPAVSLGWRVSEESFLRDNPVVDNLKLRASWAKLGDNTGIAGFQYLTGYTYPSGNYIFGDDVIPTLVSRGLANTGITWYTAKTYNVGVDFALWKGLLSGEVDVFYRKRDGLMATRAAALPGTFGASLPQENLNSDDDRGFEIVLRHQNRLSTDFSYYVNGNVSFTRSKYRHVERAQSVNSYRNWRDNTTDRWKNLFWGYEAVGQFQSYDEIARWPVQDGQGNTTLKPGDIKYLDYNGDSVIDDNDVHVISRAGKPEIMFGFDLGFTWKNFDFSMLLQGVGNYNSYYTESLQVPFHNNASSLEAFMDRWHREDLYDPNSRWIPGKYPSTYSAGLESNKRNSTFWLQNGAYMRVKDITIGYNLPKPVLNKVGLDAVRVYLSGYNLLTISSMDLLDPEAVSTGGQYYPPQRVISVGFNISL